MKIIHNRICEIYRAIPKEINVRNNKGIKINKI